MSSAEDKSELPGLRRIGLALPVEKQKLFRVSIPALVHTEHSGGLSFNPCP